MNAASSQLVMPRQRLGRRGITLIEVLTAILITGIGLLALLVLFPLGALNLARQVRDDRTGAIATDAVALGQAGIDLLSRTEDFVADSIVNGPDTKSAGALRVEAEQLEDKAEELEERLRELRPTVRPKIQRRVDQLLAEIRAIQDGFNKLASLFSLLENWGPPNNGL